MICFLHLQNDIFCEYFTFFNIIKTSTNEVFDEAITSEIKEIIQYHLLSGSSGVKVNFFSEVLVSRDEQEGKVDFSLIVHTCSIPVYNVHDIKEKTSILKEKYRAQIENLFTLENSGISIIHIKNLRLQIASLPFIRSGCLDTKVEMGVQKASLRGVTLLRD